VEINIDKLPERALRTINELKMEIQSPKILKKLHGFLAGMDKDWFTLPCPTNDSDKDSSPGIIPGPTPADMFVK
jgi:hypothetical protein